MRITVRKSTIRQRKPYDKRYIGVVMDQEAELYDGNAYVFQTYMAPVFMLGNVMKIDHENGKGYHYSDILAMDHMNKSKFIHNAPWMKRHRVEDGEYGDKFELCKSVDMFRNIITMLNWVELQGGERNLFGYNLMSDLKAMAFTHMIAPGKSLVRKNKPIHLWPNSAVNISGWDTIKFQDILGITLSRCNKFGLMYMSWVDKLDDINQIKFRVNGKYGCKLNHYIKYIKNDPSYEQLHSSPYDVDDLVTLMNFTFMSDGKFWDNNNYLPVNTDDLFMDRKSMLCT